MCCCMTLAEEFDGAASPNGPMAEEAANDAALDSFPIRLKGEGREEIEDDVVVVAGVKSDVFAAGFGNGADDIECLVPIERRDFDGDDVFDFSELTPEIERENAAADGGLQVEADDGDNLRDGAAVCK